ncbi:hypothetical protein CONPUDRAFT_167773 [Coniophora puteana RWD-64-598 SS2]|uniref:Uncharacterized protein n=1 Tax=Coniophora puteana (strain RWD-64-598) TaxID=741705 RepID=A0A5M3MEV6_CONPW|nr:uncharacterized protein CONPUDRAFT_167773 [Coniophora puteana RWD-64-598 SS2]EIW77683.1 hypothetical protein CONPUDRAFT_167773 [Coniophora puteana RWD-64-598 SS2]
MLLEAYNQHCALVLRPDDVWLAILTQFSFFVNAHAEELHSAFVSHEGNKELNVSAVGSWYSVDFGSMARQMAGELEKNMSDPKLREIGKLEEYGTEYGTETTAWFYLLKPIVERFVHAFDEPITAFCVFTTEGKWQGPRLQNLPSSSSDKSYTDLSGEVFAAKHFVSHPEGDPFIGDLYLTLNDVSYPHVNTDQIPPGTVEVDVKLDDNGQVFSTLLVAGGVGSVVSSSGDKALSGSGERDTVRPVPEWWMFVKNKKSNEEPARLSSME